LYQYGSGGLFLCSAFFVQRNEEQLALKPAVGCIFFRGEQFAVVGAFDVRNSELTADIRSDFFNDTGFCFSKAQRVNQIGFRYFLVHAVFHDFFVTYLTFKPSMHHKSLLFY
jgi:hypothetical protein